MESAVQDSGSVMAMAKDTADRDERGGASAEIGNGIKITDTPQFKLPSQAERDLAVRLASANVADAISLMMRSERHRHYSLADLEWLLMPPMLLKQVMFAYARPQLPPEKAAAAAAAGIEGEQPPQPVAMLTWARVSPEVAAKLDSQKKAGVPFRLAPQEWRSGDEVRVIDVLGQQKAADALREKLRTMDTQ
jgi:hemolysin-activating ACP:hemolysin acyltransferase